MTNEVETLNASVQSIPMRVVGGAFIAAVAVLAGGMLTPKPVSALPSFARQTGQPCATCHNGAYAQLTPFGREFKLNGYTAGGTRCHDMPAIAGGQERDFQLPLSMMVVSSFTHTQKDQPEQPVNRDGLSNGLNLNDNVMPIEGASVFLAGQLYCKLGAFIQVTYGRADDAYSLDNTEFRYATKGKVGSADVLFGMFANNNPTLDDVWNTTPAWRIPGGGWQATSFGPPIATPLIDGGLAGSVAGAGSYVFVNNMFYAAVGAYASLDRKTLKFLGESDSVTAIDGLAPYWRLAVEKNWGDYSLMFGTFGMIANMKPDITQFTPTDRYTDIGWDAQFQYLKGAHFLTLRASYIDEWLRLGGTSSATIGGADNLKNHLSELNLSATYSYNSVYSITAGYFDIRGSTDLTFFGGNIGSPNARGEVLDFGYSPWSHGGPALWPWLNTRVGVQLTHYNKTQGVSSNYDGNGRNAKDDDAIWAYSWTAF